ncbi:MAG: hypothetical protein JXO49_11530 [Deltaproteobacteria bacterium]|nr:hypothetical protein [Candidatus Anaeroferrophillus wilburensis]MBN2889965.1 hypothetical protein [Deltaproteobacteria bacterium]
MFRWPQVRSHRFPVLESSSCCTVDQREQYVQQPEVEFSLAALFPADFFSQPSPPVQFCSTQRNAQVTVYTTLESAIQERLLTLLRRYAPLAGAGVVIEPQTGAVLAMVSYRNSEQQPPVLAAGKDNYCLYAGFPAASLIKIVTAGAVLEKKGFTSSKTLPVAGRFHTLYKHQIGLKRPRFKPQSVSLEKAFSLSVNPYFGKLGIEVLGEQELQETAQEFLFDMPMVFDLPLAASQIMVPESAYERAELACGFNTETTISPLHAAMIAAVPVNGGKIMRPYLVERLVADSGEEVFFRHPETLTQPLQGKSLQDLQRLMRATVRYGTAKKAFAHLRRVRGSRDWLLGGKTGTIDLPSREGRCEWFAGYGQNGERQVGISLVLVHGKNRTISSSYLAAEIIKSALQKKPLKTVLEEHRG